MIMKHEYSVFMFFFFGGYVLVGPNKDRAFFVSVPCKLPAHFKKGSSSWNMLLLMLEYVLGKMRIYMAKERRPTQSSILYKS